MAGQFLDPPISILDAGAGLDITFCVHRAEIGELILPADQSQQGGIVPALRLHIPESSRGDGPPYFDITSRQLIAALEPLIPWIIERRRRVRIRALGTPPRVRYTVDLIV